jgi:hypothetical protein
MRIGSPAWFVMFYFALGWNFRVGFGWFSLTNPASPAWQVCVGGIGAAAFAAHMCAPEAARGPSLAPVL